jgi:hypothetical protein
MVCVAVSRSLVSAIQNNLSGNISMRTSTRRRAGPCSDAGGYVRGGRLPALVGRPPAHAAHAAPVALRPQRPQRPVTLEARCSGWDARLIRAPALGGCRAVGRLAAGGGALRGCVIVTSGQLPSRSRGSGGLPKAPTGPGGGWVGCASGRACHLVTWPYKGKP